MIPWLWHDTFLLNRRNLWTLFAVNGLGTIYGYVWYANQLAYTLATMPDWLLPFVPDSPTASLFFTFSLAFLLSDQGDVRRGGFLRQAVESFAVVTSVKYGIWAVAVILFGYAQGDAHEWQETMLIVSHLGMAAEALLYARLFTYRWPAVVLVAVWSFTNDWLDYHMGTYPWLPDELHDDLPWIERFTQMLGLLSIAAALLFRKLNVSQRV